MRYQQADIVGTMLKRVRDALGGVIFSSDIEKKIEAGMRVEWGGQEVYVKKARPHNPDSRAQDIRKKYNGRNRKALEEEYGLSRTAFYKILKGG